jgi:hypothetical protein
MPNLGWRTTNPFETKNLRENVCPAQWTGNPLVTKSKIGVNSRDFLKWGRAICFMEGNGKPCVGAV